MYGLEDAEGDDHRERHGVRGDREDEPDGERPGLGEACERGAFAGLMDDDGRVAHRERRRRRMRRVILVRMKEPLEERGRERAGSGREEGDEAGARDRLGQKMNQRDRGGGDDGEGAERRHRASPAIARERREPARRDSEREDDEGERQRHPPRLPRRERAGQLCPRACRSRRRTISATSPVQPVWCDAPSPSPLSAWKYS